MNDARVHHNWIFDNWRDGAMLFTVPDAFVSGGGAEGDIFPGISCPGAPANGISTSCGNQFFANKVGRAPNGFRFPRDVGMFGNRHAHNDARPQKPNGNDFWWGEFFDGLATGNCWYGNTGVDGTAASVTGPGEAGRLPASAPQVLPSDCATQRREQRPREAVLPHRLQRWAGCRHGTDRLRLVERAGATGERGRRGRGAEPVRCGRLGQDRATAATGRRADPAMTAFGPRWGAALLLATTVLAGCGAGSVEKVGPKVEAERDQGVGLVRAGSTAQLADCSDWRRGTVEQRRVTITSIRDQMTPQRSATAESGLSDDAAYRIFAKTCTSGIADTLRLYKIYARAQAFAAFAPETRDADD